MSYEYELRREAWKQCRETTIGISEAWWDAYRSQQHRRMHWLQLVSLSNSSSPSVDPYVQMAKMQKELTDFAQRGQEQVTHTSDAPPEKGQQVYTDWQQLALPASASSAPPKGRGRGKSQVKKGKGQKEAKGGPWTFEQISGTPKNACFKFQNWRCSESNCLREHCCVGCGGVQAEQRMPLPPGQGRCHIPLNREETLS